LLAQEDVARYLLDRGLLGPEALLDGDLAITDVSSRNRNFRVETRDGPCYLLKQAMTPQDTAMVAHEAGIYQQLGQGEDKLSGHLPRYHGYDQEQGVLVLELVRNAQSLRSLHLSSSSPSAGPAAILGSALGALHLTTHAQSPPSVPVMAPWILWVHRPDARVFRDISAAGLELIRIIQGAKGFSEALDEVRGKWRHEALMHGDVKWDNCLVRRLEDGIEELRLIDWESAAPGDPCWDIGSALSHYLSFWLFSIPVTGSEPPERFPELAGYPLDGMKPALAACWISYVDARCLNGQSSTDELLRSIELAGARLIQTAFESAQMMQQITSTIVLHLQLALNIMQRPEETATQLLGLLPSQAHAA
jgi:Ser/Thr protein kinase RdoA (MazF antagonist)